MEWSRDHGMEPRSLTPLCVDNVSLTGESPWLSPIQVILHTPQDTIMNNLSKHNDTIVNDLPTPVNQQTHFCQFCGEVIFAVAEICPKCGVRQQPPACDDAPSKVAAGLLAIFLGLLGAHKFYLGQTKLGVFYLLMNVLLCWTLIVPLIFSTICFIEGIVYLTYSDRKFTKKYGHQTE